MMEFLSKSDFVSFWFFFANVVLVVSALRADVITWVVTCSLTFDILGRIKLCASNRLYSSFLTSKRPPQMLPKIPMHRFHRSILVQSVASKFATCSKGNDFAEHNFQNNKKIANAPIPDCFLPPKGTLLCNRLYWLTQTWENPSNEYNTIMRG